MPNFFLVTWQLFQFTCWCAFCLLVHLLLSEATPWRHLAWQERKEVPIPGAKTPEWSSGVLISLICSCEVPCGGQSGSKESVIMCRFLKGICLGVAALDPTNEHAMQLGWLLCVAGVLLPFGRSFKLMSRLRAAVFTNLVGMRDALSKSGLIISPESLQQLKSCCYLYHSALNGDLVAFWNRLIAGCACLVS